MRRLLPSLCLAFTLLLPSFTRAEVPVDFWVWHRNKPLSESERTLLPALGTKTLYWHVGEMQNRTGQWRWKTPPRPTDDPAPGFRIIPVVRLTSDFRQPFPPASLPRLRDDLALIAGDSGTLQLDYDCPDRLLPEYATALRELRKSIPHLSVTALTNWPRLPGFAALTGAVEEIAPMFYDLQGDPTGVSADAPPPPLLDPAQFEAVLQPWKSCPIPWRAGLPTFARATVFDRTGLSRGQIPNWTWDDLCFHKSLRTLAPTRLGVTLLRADDNTRVAGTVVAKNELVASRFTDRAALAQAITLARAANPAGIILFRLPDNTGPAGWSLSDLAQINTANRPQLTLRRTTGDQLELLNDSAIDLPARLSGEGGDRDRGYALELDAPAPVFREALSGNFWRVTSHAQPDAEKPIAVVIPLATRLTYWFSQLPSRATLQTGLLQLAPGANLDTLRYRIVAGKDAGEWKPLAPANTNPNTP